MLTEVLRGQTQTDKIEFVLEECCSCGTPFMLPKRLQKMLINNQNTFYCPNGHPQSYCGKTEAERLKEQVAQLEKEKIKQHEILQNRWLDALGENQKLEKQLKRVHKGVCPCCNRSFTDLFRHMKTKHPEVVKSIQ
jgi:hypothetical protein